MERLNFQGCFLFILKCRVDAAVIIHDCALVIFIYFCLIEVSPDFDLFFAELSLSILAVFFFCSRL